MVQFNKHITLCLLFRSKPPASFAFRQGRQHAWSLDAAALPLPSPRPAVASSAPPPERRKLEPLRARRWRCRSQDVTVPWHTQRGWGWKQCLEKTGRNRKKQEKKIENHGFWSLGGYRLKSKAFGNGLGGRLVCEFQLGFVSHAYCPLRSAGWSFGTFLLRWCRGFNMFQSISQLSQLGKGQTLRNPNLSK